MRQLLGNQLEAQQVPPTWRTNNIPAKRRLGLPKEKRFRKVEGLIVVYSRLQKGWQYGDARGI